MSQGQHAPARSDSLPVDYARAPNPQLLPMPNLWTLSIRGSHSSVWRGIVGVLFPSILTARILGRNSHAQSDVGMSNPSNRLEEREGLDGSMIFKMCRSVYPGRPPFRRPSMPFMLPKYVLCVLILHCRHIISDKFCAMRKRYLYPR